MPRNWASVQQAAAHLAVSEATIRRMARRGDIYAERVGPRLIRVDLNSIDAHVDLDVDRHIDRIVAAAPPLTPEQRERLAGLLHGGAVA